MDFLWKVGCDALTPTDDKTVGSRAAKCLGRSVTGMDTLAVEALVRFGGPDVTDVNDEDYY